jgi:hypothetical protein
MKSLYDFCVLALGVVFEWSAMMKLVSRERWQVAGTPFATGKAAVDELVRRWLPYVELAVGLMLILRMATLFGAVVALAMLVAFTVKLIRVLKSGQHPPCLCFGSSRPRPISWKTLVRNLVLITFAVTTIVGA